MRVLHIVFRNPILAPGRQRNTLIGYIRNLVCRGGSPPACTRCIARILSTTRRINAKLRPLLRQASTCPDRGYYRKQTHRISCDLEVVSGCDGLA